MVKKKDTETLSGVASFCFALAVINFVLAIILALTDIGSSGIIMRSMGGMGSFLAQFFIIPAILLLVLGCVFANSAAESKNPRREKNKPKNKQEYTDDSF